LLGIDTKLGKNYESRCENDGEAGKVGREAFEK